MARPTTRFLCWLAAAGTLGLGCAPDDGGSDAAVDRGTDDSPAETGADADADVDVPTDLPVDADAEAEAEAEVEADAPVEAGFRETTREEVGAGWHPRLSADATGRLHLLVDDGSRLFYRTWDGSWSAPELVPGSDGVPGGKATRHRMWVSSDGSRVYVSWGTGWDTDIRFGWRDGGGWHGPETACPRTVRPWEYAAPAGRADGTAYVFCMVDDLWVARRSASGSWDAPANVWTGASKHVVAVTDDEDVIHLAFRFARVYYARGDGTTWSSPWTVTDSGDSAELPAIAVDPAGPVHLAWQRWRSDGSAWWIDSVRYARGNDDAWSGGGPGVPVHEYDAPANPPELALDATGRVVVAWVEGSAVLLSLSTDDGASFLGPWSVADDPAAVRDGALENDLATPPLAFVGADLHFVYENVSGRIMHVTGTVVP
jgi:hypothetical protein